MSDQAPQNGIAAWWSELKRRRVVRVVVVYAITSWVVIEVAATLAPNLNLPGWTVKLVIILAALGFVITAMLAWAFDIEPDGLHRTDSADAAARISHTPVETILAVLPFDNLSTDAEMQFFSDGVSEEIIQRLARGSSLKLIGRTSSFQFRGADKASASAKLGCSHVLDGTIRRAAGRVRINAHLVEAASGTTIWSDRYDRSLEDIFSVQDDISEKISAALSQTFSCFSSEAVDPADYDLYLRASLKSYAPDELKAKIGLLDVATQRAPLFAAAWARLAYQRAWLRFYEPYRDRHLSATAIVREADLALAIDPENVDALIAKMFVIAPFGRFVELAEALQRVRQAPGMGDGKKYIGWSLRTMGHVRDSVTEDERIYTTDPLDPMCANVVALARMAAGRVEEAIPVYEDLLARVPEMSFPLTSLLRAKALLEDWAGVDALLDLVGQRPIREFEEGLAFIRTKRHPTADNIRMWWDGLRSHVDKTGWIDCSRLVYAAHLGLVDEAYALAENARLGPTGASEDIMGPDAYRTSILFQAGLPELRDDPRFLRLCARLGLVEYWTVTGRWPDCVDEVPYDFRTECKQSRNIQKEIFWP
ncbi:MAG: hypothetical protein OEW64_10040 [Gammaproteobacteria bacterium]|nr:hypothetical protein [Gammaproteobacteria bacterium]MDH5304424.1 hypothetical protein [Gammaproteobacteria bacterium]MDH5322067.1 hypothetical protein [Gammaproteobacteria bacterium]